MAKGVQPEREEGWAPWCSRRSLKGDHGNANRLGILQGGTSNTGRKGGTSSAGSQGGVGSSGSQGGAGSVRSQGRTGSSASQGVTVSAVSQGGAGAGLRNSLSGEGSEISLYGVGSGAESGADFGVEVLMEKLDTGSGFAGVPRSFWDGTGQQQGMSSN
ncbi:sericin-1-like [Labeo rohita]|uniref:sericin-1-like n=1 Tax=Labeo rohita TaxID=84645 RepID=UPI0021E2150F|nr:sericin-1-like [Labeo rohita]